MFGRRIRSVAQLPYARKTPFLAHPYVWPICPFSIADGILLYSHFLELMKGNLDRSGGEHNALLQVGETSTEGEILS